MKNRSVLLWSLVTIGVSLVAGFLLPSVTQGKTVAANSGDPLNFKTSKSSRANDAREESSRGQQIRKRVEQSEGSEHWLHWISAIENASLDEFPQLARIAQGNEIFLQLLAQRWFDSDPWHFFHSLEKESDTFSNDPEESFPHGRLSRLLFEKWVRKDADSAIEALSSATKLYGLAGIRMTVFSDVVELDPRSGLPLMKKWGIHNYGPNTKGVEKWARENPEAAAAAIIENAAGFGTEYCMKAVAKVWAKSDPAGALAFAADAKGKEGAILRETVFREWLGKDMAAASDWLTERNDPELDDYYRPMVIEEWAKDEPQEALAWCDEHLTGADLTEAISKLVEGVAAVDIDSAADLVGELEPGEPQQQAAVAVAKKWFPWGFESSGEVPPQAVEWLRGLEDPKVLEAALDEVSWSWSTHDVEGFRSFVTEKGIQSLTAQAFGQLMSASVRNDPEGTLEWASGLGEERSLSASNKAFGSWLYMQPEQASTWFAELPQNDVRRPAMLKSLVTGAVSSQQEAVAVVKLSGLSASDRAEARTIVEESQFSEKRKERMRKLLAE